MSHQTTVPLGNGREGSRPRTTTVPKGYKNLLLQLGNKSGLGLSLRTGRELKPPTELPGQASLSTVWGHGVWDRPRSTLAVLLYDLGGGREQGQSFPGLLKSRNVKF